MKEKSMYQKSSESHVFNDSVMKATSSKGRLQRY